MILWIRLKKMPPWFLAKRQALSANPNPYAGDREAIDLTATMAQIGNDGVRVAHTSPILLPPLRTQRDTASC